MPSEPRSPRLAVLIDADNASVKIADGLFEEIAKIGEASVRRIYGDFSSARSKTWAEILAKHAIIPQQQFAYPTGKNASDITLVIDAMDLLHSGRFDGYCLVSSDLKFFRCQHFPERWTPYSPGTFPSFGHCLASSGGRKSDVFTSRYRIRTACCSRIAVSTSLTWIRLRERQGRFWRKWRSMECRKSRSTAFQSSCRTPIVFRLSRFGWFSRRYRMVPMKLDLVR